MPHSWLRRCMFDLCEAAVYALSDEETWCGTNIWHTWWSTQQRQCSYCTARHESPLGMNHRIRSREAALLTSGESRVWPKFRLKFIASIVGAMRFFTYCTFMTCKRRELDTIMIRLWLIRLWRMIAEFDVDGRVATSRSASMQPTIVSMYMCFNHPRHQLQVSCRCVTHKQISIDVHAQWKYKFVHLNAGAQNEKRHYFKTWPCLSSHV